MEINSEINEALKELMSIALDLNSKTSHDIFVRLSGHTNNIEVDIHYGGWERNNTGNSATLLTSYLDREPKKALKKINSTLEKLRKLYPSASSKRVCPLKYKKKKPLVLLTARRVGKTATAELNEVASV